MPAICEAPSGSVRTTTGKMVYKSFEEMYSKENVPADVHCPSLLKAAPTNKSYAFNLTTARARALAWCSDCSKPRLIYSERALCENAYKDLMLFLDRFQYTCGSPVVPEGHDLKAIVFIKTHIRCHDAVSAQYYSAGDRLGSSFVRELCFYCGSTDVLEEPEVAAQFASFSPRCLRCKSMGHVQSRARKRVAARTGLSRPSSRGRAR